MSLPPPYCCVLGVAVPAEGMQAVQRDEVARRLVLVADRASLRLVALVVQANLYEPLEGRLRVVGGPRHLLLSSS